MKLEKQFVKPNACIRVCIKIDKEPKIIPEKLLGEE